MVDAGILDESIKHALTRCQSDERSEEIGESAGCCTIVPTCSQLIQQPSCFFPNRGLRVFQPSDDIFNVLPSWSMVGIPQRLSDGLPKSTGQSVHRHCSRQTSGEFFDQFRNIVTPFSEGFYLCC